ncbi:MULTISPECIES: competence type IV pilus minor pilin ComGG [Oceanobacillus]|uniref:ComG operon protein 7 n=1 Tax=Oceanobacillus kimchii TaxID=746691 RepID=A0ABQ5TLR8_9BACI|nr:MULTISPECIES: competence type IV pilus minor pilin ComGG [Oceanobacillus]MBT2598334.1 hypothetical protein [Oceanobacillus sp. ISL-74]MBT2651252.1 hypothetical protein [Oceanobacillus sp. ISL-73]MCT1575911.1 ComGG family competence protein [Oceanobacillus kimchii]MCT2135548.1 ComGG family competence protein [Oceanobacillus kimchii]GLO66568.1 hypothetical protein MACH08_23520 [Oceanobacillus kimchii]
MKKQLVFINNEQGFLFIYVIWIISFLFLSLTLLTIYNHHDKKITDFHLKLLQSETLFQMSKVDVENDLEEFMDTQKPKYYSYPDGQVKVQIKSRKQHIFSLSFTIFLEEDPFYSYEHFYAIDE